MCTAATPPGAKEERPVVDKVSVMSELKHPSQYAWQLMLEFAQKDSLQCLHGSLLWTVEWLLSAAAVLSSSARDTLGL